MQSCIGELAACLLLWTNSFFVAVVASPTDAMRFARNMLQIASDCPVGEIGKRRLKRALHKAQDVCHLEVQLKGFGSWQPACTIPESLLSKYFASLADKNIRHRSRPPQVCFATAFLPHLVECYIASLEPWCLQERATDREQKAEVLGRYATWTSSAEDLSGFMEFCAAKARERAQDAQGDRSARSSCCQNRRVLAMVSGPHHAPPLRRTCCGCARVQWSRESFAALSPLLDAAAPNASNPDDSP